MSAPAEFVAFDLETTGRSPACHEILEIGACRFAEDGTVLGEYQTLANPGTEIPPFVQNLTGITKETVCGAPRPIDAVRRFLAWCDGADAFLAHNANFDMRFLAAACFAHHEPAPTFPLIDTVALARKAFPLLPNHRLGTVAGHLGLSPQGAHRALADARVVMALACTVMRAAPHGPRALLALAKRPPKRCAAGDMFADAAEGRL